MKYINFYKEQLNCQNEDEVFDYLIQNLKPSIILWSYFVNWDKVFNNTKKIEITLNTLNYLIGKEDFDSEFKFLIKQKPEIANVIPALVVRDGSNTNRFNILVDYQKKKLVYEEYDFSKKEMTDKDVEKYLRFVKETGLKDLITAQKIKNLVDYMIGVETGLDSNGRKNRGGHSMESIIEFFIKDVCESKKYSYIKEATSEKINKEWGYDVPVDKSSRRYDFVVNTGKELVIFETNFYGGSGSKLKSTAGEYRDLFNVLKGQYKFIWITDGNGWKSTARPLRETFNHNDYVISLEMVEKGILNEIF
ncbi:MAG: type II restriction endonuclease [Candidatus Pacebacteria bacterium]|nr:type II restriction endonuclease [Candidatus Paceibacterota bacterium]